jgi:hypothetical protein
MLTPFVAEKLKPCIGGYNTPPYFFGIPAPKKLCYNVYNVFHSERGSVSCL